MQCLVEVHNPHVRTEKHRDNSDHELTQIGVSQQAHDVKHKFVRLLGWSCPELFDEIVTKFSCIFSVLFNIWMIQWWPEHGLWRTCGNGLYVMPSNERATPSTYHWGLERVLLWELQLQVKLLATVW